MNKDIEWLNILVFFVSSISEAVPLFVFIQTSSEQVKTQTYIIFGIIILVLVIGFFLNYIIVRWSKVSKDINTTKEEIENMKKVLDLNETFNHIDVRLSVLEALVTMKKNKKGQTIDPRFVFIILLLILLYLFLKSAGIFN